MYDQMIGSVAGAAMENMPYFSLEFVGGPYDGYTPAVEVPAENLLDMVSLPINGNVLRVINGSSPGEDTPTLNVAVYALDSEGDDRRYRFMGARPIGGLDWDSWCAGICKAWRESREHSRAKEFE